MRTPVLFRALIWLWLLAALYTAHGRLLLALSPWLWPVIVAALTALVVIAAFKMPIIRDWFAQVEVRSLVLLHVARFVGYYFLLMAARGELPADFAFASGWSENFIAGAAAVLGIAPLKGAWRRHALSVWNIVGASGMAFLVLNSARAMAEDPELLRKFADLPLALLPTFLMPLTLALHVVIFIRLQREARNEKLSSSDLE